MSFKFGKKSEERLQNVHEDLVRVVRRALEISTIDFQVGEGARTLKTQREYVLRGVSKTMRSRHIAELNACRKACAVDLWPLADIDADGDLDVVWDSQFYFPIAKAMKQAASELNINVQWGFDLWGWDMPHFQLSVKDYPWA